MRFCSFGIVALLGGLASIGPGHEAAADAPLAGILSEIDGGVLAHDVPGLISGTHLEHGVTFNGQAILAPSLALLGGSIHPDFGASVTTAGGTSYAYADAEYRIVTPFGLYFGLGLGAAVHDGYLDPTSPVHKALGSRVLFHIPAEAGIQFAGHYSVAIYFEHVSNAWLARDNEGLDNLGLRFGYRF